MGDPYVQVTWGHYYHVGGGSFIHSFQYPPPASFFPLGLQPSFYGTHIPPGSYGCYQPSWNLACPGPPEAAKNPDTPVTISEDCSEQEFASESHDPMPMDISPNGSPAKQPSQPLVRFRGTVASFQPEKKTCTKSASKLTKSVLPRSSSERATSHTAKAVDRTKTRWSNPPPTASSALSLVKCNACIRRMLVQASGASSCLNVEPCTCVQTPQERESIECKSPKTSAQETMSQHHNEFIHHLKEATEKNVAITTESARPCVVRSVANQSQHVLPHVVEPVASHSRYVHPCVLGSGAGRSQRVEPCVSQSGASWSQRVQPCDLGSGVSRSQRVEPCVSRSGAGWSRHVKPCVSRSGASRSRCMETITKPSFNQYAHDNRRAANNAAVKPRRRVIVRRINGVARLFSVSARSPLKPNTEYTLIGKGTVKPLDSPISNPKKEAKQDEIAAKEFVTKMAIPEQSSKHKSESKSSAKGLKQEKHSPIGHSTKNVAHNGPANAMQIPDDLRGKLARRRRQKWRQKQRKILASLPPSASEMCSDDSSTIAFCTQKSASTDPSNIHEDVLGSKEPVNDGLHTSMKSSGSRHVKVNKAVSRAALSCSVSLESPGVRDADSTRLLCKEQPHTSDVLCSEKPVTNDAVKVISGIYAPGKVFVTVTTCTDIEVDPLLGGCEERGDGPFELQSQLQKLDEGWMWSFD